MAERYSGYGMPEVDFGILGNLGTVHKKAQMDAVRERTLADLGKGGGPLNYGDAAKALLAAGDTEGGLSLAKLADAQALRDYNMKKDERNFGFQQQEATRAQGNTDRSFGLQKQTFDEAARGVDYKEIDDGSGGKTLVRIRKATGEIDRPAIGGAPLQPNNPFAVGGSMKEHEGKSALFADRAASAHEVLNKFENINNSKSGYAGGLAEKVIPEAAFNQIASADRQQFMNSKRSFVNALLRRESGAAINASEFASYDKEYFPQPGDDAKVIDQKRMHRAEVIAGLAREAGRTYQPNYSFDERGAITRTKKPLLGTPKPVVQATENILSAIPEGAGPNEGVNIAADFAGRFKGQEDAPGMDAVSQAKAAIARGADPKAVMERLRKIQAGL